VGECCGTRQKRAKAVNGEDRSKPQAEASERTVPVAWAALEDAFENNAPEVHSYLHMVTGDVIRVVDGVADPVTHARIVADGAYRRVDPVSSREQYRWMERYIATVEDAVVRQRLLQSIDGKGAFRRFKDALMTFPVERERWFTFRSERLRMCMEAWLDSQQIATTPRPDWPVAAPTDAPPAEEPALEVVVPSERPATVASVRRPSVPLPALGRVELQRSRLLQLAGSLAATELDAALGFLEYLQERRPGAAQGAPQPVTPSQAEEATADELLALRTDGIARSAAPITPRDSEVPSPRRIVAPRDPDTSRVVSPEVDPAAESDPSRRSSSRG
jgi:hypothetical protein